MNTEKLLKSDLLRYKEFYNSMKLLRVALDNVAQRKDEYFISLSVLLRAMFIPSWKSKIMDFTGNIDEFICIHLAKTLGVDLYLYTKPTTYESKECQYFKHLFDTTLEPTTENTQKQTLLEWLKNDIVEVPVKKFKIVEVIKVFADRNGGAHFDSSDSKENVLLCNAVNKAGIKIIYLVLAKIGEILYKVGFKIIKSIFDIQLVVSFALPKNQNLSGKNIMTVKYENAHCPLSLRVNENNMLNLTLSESNSKSYNFDIYDFKNNTDLLVVNISYELTERMEAILKTYCNHCYCEIKIHDLIFIGSSFMYNSSIEFSDDGIRIGLSALSIYKKVNNNYSYFYNDMQIAKLGNTGVLEGKFKGTYEINNDIKLDRVPFYMPFLEFVQ